MDNFIIIGIIAVIIVVAVAVLIKRAGRKGCCSSGSDVKPRRKKLSHIAASKSFKIDGMKCEKCANRVTEVINDIPHVAGVVDLKKGIATVSYEEDVPDELIKARIEHAGYTVTDIT